MARLVASLDDNEEKPRRSERSAAKAKELAAKTIDRLVDLTAPAEEQASRKHRLLKGAEEFRDLRVDRLKKEVTDLWTEIYSTARDITSRWSEGP